LDTINIVYDFIETNNLIPKESKILVAVSGGIDSVTLLDILIKLQKKLEIKQISIAHFNHKLRAQESTRDLEFVRNLADQYKIDFYFEESSIKKLAASKKLSIQECARMFRLDFLERIAVKTKSNIIATGHNKDDLAETTFMWLCRGTSLDGLKGIPIKRGKFIRPILSISREEIIKYSIKNKLLFVEDSSNYSTNYIRNYIRNKIFPLLQENCYPRVKENISKFSNIIKEDLAFLELVSKKYEKKYLKDILFGKEINLKDFNKLHNAIKNRILKNAISSISNHNLKNINNKNLSDIINLCSKDSRGTKTIALPYDIIAKRTYNTLVISKKNAANKTQNLEYEISFPGVSNIDNYSLSITTSLLPGLNEIANYNLSKTGFAYFNYEKIEFPLKIRLAKQADRFKPLGSTAYKKLSDFFIDNKIPADKRWLTPIITSNEKIIWVLGYRIDEDYRVNYTTKNVLQISYKYL